MDILIATNQVSMNICVEILSYTCIIIFIGKIFSQIVGSYGLFGIF